MNSYFKIYKNLNPGGSCPFEFLVFFKGRGEEHLALCLDFDDMIEKIEILDVDFIEESAMEFNDEYLTLISNEDYSFILLKEIQSTNRLHDVRKTFMGHFPEKS